MKKIIFAAIAFITLGLASCEKENVGGTATQAMSGDWVMTFSDGTNSYDIPHGLTFNTSDNVSDEIWVTDVTRFWNFKVKAKCDQSTLTFATDGWVDNTDCTMEVEYTDDEGVVRKKTVPYECKIRITNGKITLNGETLPSGRVVDVISYDIEFDDDDPGNVWHATGHRYTGFQEDN